MSPQDDDDFIPFPDQSTPTIARHPSGGGGSFANHNGEEVIPLKSRAAGFAKNSTQAGYFGYGRGDATPEVQEQKPSSSVRVRTQTNIPLKRSGPYVAYAQYIKPPKERSAAEAARLSVPKAPKTPPAQSAQVRSTTPRGGTAHRGTFPPVVRSVSPSPNVRRVSASPTWSYSCKPKGIFSSNYVSPSQPAAAATARVKAARSKTPPMVGRKSAWKYVKGVGCGGGAPLIHGGFKLITELSACVRCLVVMLFVFVKDVQYVKHIHLATVLFCGDMCIEKPTTPQKKNKYNNNPQLLEHNGDRGFLVRGVVVA